MGIDQFSTLLLDKNDLWFTTLAQQDQAENQNHVWGHFTETGQDKMRQPFPYYLFIFYFFHLTVLGISFYLDFMGVI